MPAEGASGLFTRSYEEGDESSILELFGRSFHIQRSRDHWVWKYARNPFGSHHISLTLDHAGRLAGHYAGYVAPFRVDGQDLVAHQVGDTMTEASVRHLGRGVTSVLGRTASHFYQTFCDGRVAFNYGFNVANIQKFSLRFLRSERVEGVCYRARDLRLDPITAIRRPERWRKGYQLEQVTVAGPELDRFFERSSRGYDFLVRRDAEWVRWRYLECPDVRYIVVAIRKWGRMAGWIAYRIREGRFVAGDALFDRDFPGALDVLLRHVVPGHPVHTVEGWFADRPAWFSSQLSDQGLRILPEPQDLSLMCVPFTMTDAASRMASSLYYTMGDSDLF